MTQQFFGKYRGKVEDNQDPNKLGRIKVSVPAVMGDNGDSWAMPCTPYAGKSVGFFALPPVGSSVWVEFEGGNTASPIWTGCFWEKGELPAQPADAAIKMLKTDTVTITLNDSSDSSGITIETKEGMKIVINGDGIELNNGKGASIKLSSSTVRINNDALELT